MAPGCRRGSAPPSWRLPRGHLLQAKARRMSWCAVAPRAPLPRARPRPLPGCCLRLRADAAPPTAHRPSPLPPPPRPPTPSPFPPARCASPGPRQPRARAPAIRTQAALKEETGGRGGKPLCKAYVSYCDTCSGPKMSTRDMATLLDVAASTVGDWRKKLKADGAGLSPEQCTLSLNFYHLCMQERAKATLTVNNK